MEDTFARTIPDMQARLREEEEGEWQRQTLQQMARAGRALEIREENLRARLEALERKEAERKGAARVLDWLIRVGIAVAGLLVGKHLMK